MFQDQLQRNSQGRLGWYIGWERYTISAALLIGVTASAAISQIRELDQLAELRELDGSQIEQVSTCQEIREIGVFMLVVAGQFLQQMSTVNGKRSHLLEGHEN